ncbi:MAG TPA: class I SAM-dependent methyltransferase [Candidatus Polarisedimenticolaceae bacterium]|nr:class I SAM-dependent methyltransferase [Candidatus Polarisedimenticolaceae bacterium]
MSVWPKVLPPLDPATRRIHDEFMHDWLEALPRRYGFADRFNHRYPASRSGGFTTTLEIGAGTGEHLRWENLSEAQKEGYVALDLRENVAARFRERHPGVRVVVGDCQTRLAFDDASFDRILAIHVFEHLPDLPRAIDEAHRLLAKPAGRLHVVIPCEGGLAYTLARRISAQRQFERRYRLPYRQFIEREHLSRPGEVVRELERRFTVVHRAFFPMKLPAIFCNLFIGLTLAPR